MAKILPITAGRAAGETPASSSQGGQVGDTGAPFSLTLNDVRNFQRVAARGEPKVTGAYPTSGGDAVADAKAHAVLEAFMRLLA